MTGCRSRPPGRVRLVPVAIVCAVAWLAPAVGVDGAAAAVAVPAASGTARVPVATPAVAARLTVPALGLRNAVVVGHRGAPDDANGTAIQDRGLLAMPLGSRGGTLPGRVGNVVITGHRTSAARTFWSLPRLRPGQLLTIGYGRDLFTYRITGALYVDVTVPASLAQITAAVPGHPGVAATRSMVTLVTCATIEDNARGDRFRDAHGNPRHRIVRYGVLVARTRA